MKPLPPQQLAFDSVLFKNRTVLYVREVAEKLRVTEQHVHNLIEDGSLQAYDAAGGNSVRKCWRIPVESYEAFLQKRKS